MQVKEDVGTSKPQKYVNKIGLLTWDPKIKQTTFI